MTRKLFSGEVVAEGAIDMRLKSKEPNAVSNDEVWRAANASCARGSATCGFGGVEVVTLQTASPGSTEFAVHCTQSGLCLSTSEEFQTRLDNLSGRVAQREARPKS